ncbi:uncharacterized protein PHALS_14080 [Plasmopara halstedii]|uniref:Uncharacterized protein n=1 Tax=Plasmopara halstedii TaxID=4781 RepID=A0A0P1AR75_PLAHL|nr:uncharacterized protein PHALS_14080 [Plasmopara halstedii]CEG43788.1 hypothetical protein PHALS_14080 [Plasmopara halstedii]|eukprot:XP_024580157.1 hypothetical protein PHALS_14080 [Plasmopara halstedii]
MQVYTMQRYGEGCIDPKFPHLPLCSCLRKAPKGEENACLPAQDDQGASLESNTAASNR